MFITYMRRIVRTSLRLCITSKEVLVVWLCSLSATLWNIWL